MTKLLGLIFRPMPEEYRDGFAGAPADAEIAEIGDVTLIWSPSERRLSEIWLTDAGDVRQRDWTPEALFSRRDFTDVSK